MNCINYSQFRSYLHGGGSPTKALLDAIMAKWPGLPLSDLIAKLKIMNRNDVAADLTAVMKKRKCELSLEDLTLEEKDYFRKLDGRGSNWENLAELLEFSYSERKTFKGEEARPNNWSPTKAILEKLFSVEPQFLLNEFEKILREIKRNDLANIIQEFIRKCKQNKLPTNTTTTTNTAITTSDNFTARTNATTTTTETLLQQPIKKLQQPIPHHHQAATLLQQQIPQQQPQAAILLQQPMPQQQQATTLTTSTEPILEESSPSSSCFCW